MAYYDVSHIRDLGDQWIETSQNLLGYLATMHGSVQSMGTGWTGKAGRAAQVVWNGSQTGEHNIWNEIWQAAWVAQQIGQSIHDYADELQKTIKEINKEHLIESLTGVFGLVFAAVMIPLGEVLEELAVAVGQLVKAFAQWAGVAEAAAASVGNVSTFIADQVINAAVTVYSDVAAQTYASAIVNGPGKIDWSGEGVNLGLALFPGLALHGADHLFSDNADVKAPKLPSVASGEVPDVSPHIHVPGASSGDLPGLHGPLDVGRALPGAMDLNWFRMNSVIKTDRTHEPGFGATSPGTDASRSTVRPPDGAPGKDNAEPTSGTTQAFLDSPPRSAGDGRRDPASTGTAPHGTGGGGRPVAVGGSDVRSEVPPTAGDQSRGSAEPQAPTPNTSASHGGGVRNDVGSRTESSHNGDTHSAGSQAPVASHGGGVEGARAADSVGGVRAEGDRGTGATGDPAHGAGTTGEVAPADVNRRTDMRSAADAPSAGRPSAVTGRGPGVEAEAQHHAPDGPAKGMEAPTAAKSPDGTGRSVADPTEKTSTSAAGPHDSGSATSGHPAGNSGGERSVEAVTKSAGHHHRHDGAPSAVSPSGHDAVGTRVGGPDHRPALPAAEAVRKHEQWGAFKQQQVERHHELVEAESHLEFDSKGLDTAWRHGYDHFAEHHLTAEQTLPHDGPVARNARWQWRRDITRAFRAEIDRTGRLSHAARIRIIEDAKANSYRYLIRAEQVDRFATRFKEQLKAYQENRFGYGEALPQFDEAPSKYRYDSALQTYVKDDAKLYGYRQETGDRPGREAASGEHTTGTVEHFGDRSHDFNALEQLHIVKQEEVIQIINGSLRDHGSPGPLPTHAARKIDELTDTLFQEIGRLANQEHDIRVATGEAFEEAVWQAKDLGALTEDHVDRVRLDLYRDLRADHELVFAHGDGEGPRRLWELTTARAIDDLPTRIEKERFIRSQLAAETEHAERQLSDLGDYFLDHFGKGGRQRVIGEYLHAVRTTADRHFSGEGGSRRGTEASAAWSGIRKSLRSSLPDRIRHEGDLQAVVGDSAHAFHEMLGHPGSLDASQLHEDTLRRLGNDFRAERVEKFDELFAPEGHKTDAWLAHESHHEDGFQSRLDDLRSGEYFSDLREENYPAFKDWRTAVQASHEERPPVRPDASQPVTGSEHAGTAAKDAGADASTAPPGEQKTGDQQQVTAGRTSETHQEAGGSETPGTTTDHAPPLEDQVPPPVHAAKEHDAVDLLTATSHESERAGAEPQTHGEVQELRPQGSGVAASEAEHKGTDRPEFVEGSSRGAVREVDRGGSEHERAFAAAVAEAAVDEPALRGLPVDVVREAFRVQQVADPSIPGMRQLERLQDLAQIARELHENGPAAADTLAGQLAVNGGRAGAFAGTHEQATVPGRPKGKVRPARQQPVDQQEHRRFATFESELKRLVVRPEADSAQVSRAIASFLEGVPGERRVALVGDIRLLIDTLPDREYPDESVNAAHKALDAFDVNRPVLAVPGAEYVSSSRVTEGPGQGFVNRDIPESVVIDGEVHVPVYTAVFGDALGSDRPRFKDVGQDADGVVQVHTGSEGVAESALWVSLGQPLRQVKWVDKYRASGAAEPMVRSFLVPLRTVNEISRAAVTEHNSSGNVLDLNVDKHFASNQFGIREPRSLELLRTTALPGSLRTYTDGDVEGRPSSWGDVRPLGELRERLGVPSEAMPGFDVFTEGTNFLAPQKYEATARTLREVVASHLNNSRLREPGDRVLSAKAVEDFFDQHAPARLKQDIATRAAKRAAVDVFVRETVAPWAAQARITQALHEGFEELHASDPSPVPVDYQLTDVRPMMRGQRRTVARRLGMEHAGRMEVRFAIRRGYEALGADIGDAIKSEQTHMRAELHKLKQRRAQVLEDYPFKIGERITLPAKIDEYRGVAAAAHQGITDALRGAEPSPRVQRILDALTHIQSDTPARSHETERTPVSEVDDFFVRSVNAGLKKQGKEKVSVWQVHQAHRQLESSRGAAFSRGNSVDRQNAVVHHLAGLDRPVITAGARAVTSSASEGEFVEGSSRGAVPEVDRGGSEHERAFAAAVAEAAVDEPALRGLPVDVVREAFRVQQVADPSIPGMRQLERLQDLAQIARELHENGPVAAETLAAQLASDGGRARSQTANAESATDHSVPEAQLSSDPERFLKSNVMSMDMARGLELHAPGLSAVDRARFLRALDVMGGQEGHLPQHRFALVPKEEDTSSRPVFALTPAVEWYVAHYGADRLGIPEAASLPPLRANSHYVHAAYVPYLTQSPRDYANRVGHASVPRVPGTTGPRLVVTPTMNGCAYAVAPHADPALMTVWHYQSPDSHMPHPVQFRREQQPTDWFGAGEYYEAAGNGSLFEVANLMWFSRDGWEFVSQENHTSSQDKSVVTLKHVRRRPVVVEPGREAAHTVAAYQSLVRSELHDWDLPQALRSIEGVRPPGRDIEGLREVHRRIEQHIAGEIAQLGHVQDLRALRKLASVFKAERAALKPELEHLIAKSAAEAAPWVRTASAKAVSTRTELAREMVDRFVHRPAKGWIDQLRSEGAPRHPKSLAALYEVKARDELDDPGSTVNARIRDLRAEKFTGAMQSFLPKLETAVRAEIEWEIRELGRVEDLEDLGRLAKVFQERRRGIELQHVSELAADMQSWPTKERRKASRALELVKQVLQGLVEPKLDEWIKELRQEADQLARGSAWQRLRRTDQEDLGRTVAASLPGGIDQDGLFDLRVQRAYDGLDESMLDRPMEARAAEVAEALTEGRGPLGWTSTSSSR